MNLLEMIMSALTPNLQKLKSDLIAANSEATALKASNAQLAATVTEKQIAIDAANTQVTTLQGQLTALQAQLVAANDPADAQLVAEALQLTSDLRGVLT